MTHDGLGKYLSQIIEKAPGPTADIVGILKETKTDVVINYLPVGSEMATKWYVEQVLEAGCGLINCIPVFIASQKYWQKRFQERGLPVIGDDIKSQVGATILHRTLVNLYLDRGMPIDRTYQLNTGGNTDFLNMLERERLDSKKISKTNAVVSQIRNRGLDIDPDNVHVGPSDYVPWQKDNKVCFLRIESRHFGDVPDEPRVPAVGRGLAELGRRRHRRPPLRASWRSTTASPGALFGPSALLHEVPPEAVHRHRGQGADGEVHPQLREEGRRARKPAPKAGRQGEGLKLP